MFFLIISKKREKFERIINYFSNMIFFWSLNSKIFRWCKNTYIIQKLIHFVSKLYAKNRKKYSRKFCINNSKRIYKKYFNRLNWAGILYYKLEEILDKYDILKGRRFSLTYYNLIITNLFYEYLCANPGITHFNFKNNYNLDKDDFKLWMEYYLKDEKFTYEKHILSVRFFEWITKLNRDDYYNLHEAKSILYEEKYLENKEDDFNNEIIDDVLDKIISA